MNDIRAIGVVLEVGRLILEEVYGVEYSEINDNQDELSQQIEADLNGWGINGVQK